MRVTLSGTTAKQSAPGSVWALFSLASGASAAAGSSMASSGAASAVSISCAASSVSAGEASTEREAVSGAVEPA